MTCFFGYILNSFILRHKAHFCLMCIITALVRQCIFRFFFLIVNIVNGEIALQNVLFKMFVSNEIIYTFDPLWRTSITDIVYHKIKKNNQNLLAKMQSTFQINVNLIPDIINQPYSLTLKNRTHILTLILTFDNTKFMISCHIAPLK